MNVLTCTNAKVKNLYHRNFFALGELHVKASLPDCIHDASFERHPCVTPKEGRGHISSHYESNTANVAGNRKQTTIFLCSLPWWHFSNLLGACLELSGIKTGSIAPRLSKSEHKRQEKVFLRRNLHQSVCSFTVLCSCKNPNLKHWPVQAFMNP